MHSPIRISNTNDIKCCCGKSCKGTRGLKMHQRNCRVIHGLNDELLADLEEQSTKDSANTSVYSTAEDTDNMANNIKNQSFPVLKKGINLPKSDADWLTVFHF